MSENRGDDFAPFDRPNQDGAVEDDVFRKEFAYMGGCELAGFPQFA